MLDELRFSRGIELDPKHRNAVTVRRLKDEILKPTVLGTSLRILKPRDEKTDPDFYLDLSSEEQELFELLDLYSQKELKN